MYYEINVSVLSNIHLFATHDRSITSEERARQVTALLREKFPESEGYKVTCTKWETIGKPVDF